MRVYGKSALARIAGSQVCKETKSHNTVTTLWKSLESLCKYFIHVIVFTEVFAMARTRECDMDGPLMLIVVWGLAVRESTLFVLPPLLLRAVLLPRILKNKHVGSNMSRSAGDRIVCW